MPQEQSDYDKLQLCSERISSMIELEKQSREGKVMVDGEELPFPPELIGRLKERFRDTRVEIIVMMNTIHL